MSSQHFKQKLLSVDKILKPNEKGSKKKRSHKAKYNAHNFNHFRRQRAALLEYFIQYTETKVFITQ